jgi:transketolase
MVPEALRAAWLLKTEYGIETRVINQHTLKPFNPQALIAAARDTGIIVTAEEHQIGGLANWVSLALHTASELHGLPLAFGTIGVRDRFGESGQPWELMWEFEVSGEHIAARAKELYDFVKEHKGAKVKKPKAVTKAEGDAEAARKHTPGKAESKPVRKAARKPKDEAK